MRMMACGNRRSTRMPVAFLGIVLSSFCCSALAEAPIQSVPAAAFNGRDSYLVVWQEGWNGWGSAGSDIAGAWIKKGTPERIERQKTLISSGRDSQEIPNLAHGNGMFLVVWQDLRNGRDYDVYGTRVAADGTVMDPNGFLIGGGPHNQITPTVTFDGRDFVVAWSDFSDGVRYAMQGAKVTTGGNVSSLRENYLFKSDDSHFLRPRLAHTASGTWLFWTEARFRHGLFAAQLPKGQSMRVTPTNLNSERDIALVANDRQVMAAWVFTQQSGRTRDVVGVVWDTVNQTLVAPTDKSVVPFEKIGQGIFRDVLWLEDGNNRKRNRPNIDRVESAQTAFDGKLFWAVWSATNRQKGEAVVFQILARPVDPVTGSFLGELPRVLASASTPLRHPFLVSDGSGDLVLIYEAESPNGERAIRSTKVAR